MTTILGLDLAWVECNPSGAVVVRNRGDGGWRAEPPVTLGGDDEIVEWAQSEAGPCCVLGIRPPQDDPQTRATQVTPAAVLRHRS